MKSTRSQRPAQNPKALMVVFNRDPCALAPAPTIVSEITLQYATVRTGNPATQRRPVHKGLRTVLSRGDSIIAHTPTTGVQNLRICRYEKRTPRRRGTFHPRATTRTTDSIVLAVIAL